MLKPDGPVKCYIAGFHHPQMDPFYESNGFARGITLFAIPSHGILFKCRVDGDRTDLEFAAFFALLRFISTKLKDEKIKQVMVLSSDPEFVFSFAGRGRHIGKGSARDRLLREHSQNFKISVSYVQPQNNAALTPLADFPSIPRDRKPVLRPDTDDQNRHEFKPIQRGIKI